MSTAAVSTTDVPAPRRSGSITIFAALTFMLVGQMIFSLLEVARNVEFNKVLQMDADSVIESEFAEYVTPLWETYRLLGWSAEDSGGDFSLASAEAAMKSVSEVNLATSGGVLSGTTLLAASMEDAQVTSYELITDGGGSAYEEAVCGYMGNNILYEEAKALAERYESQDSDLSSSDVEENAVDGALGAIESAQEDESAAETSSYAGSSAATAVMLGSALSSSSAERGFSAVTLAARTLTPVISREVQSGTVTAIALDAESDADSDAEISEADKALAESGNSLLNSVSSTKKGFTLSLVLESDATVSGISITQSEAVSGRTLESGTYESEDTSNFWNDAIDKVYLSQYFLHYMSDYTNPSDSSGMKYELEYLIGGDPSDQKNLAAVASDLLLIREAANIVSLGKSSKMDEAAAMADAIAAVILNPELAPVIEAGIIAAWAYGESVLDVRALLQGDKISLIKSDEEWTTNLSEIPDLLTGDFVKAKDCSSGMSYKDYLGLLLYTKGSSKLSMRAMDLQEAAIRNVSGYEDFRMDCVMIRASVEATYSYKPVFLGFVTLVEHSGDGFQITKTTDYSYMSSGET